MRPLTVACSLLPALLLTACDLGGEKQRLNAELTQLKERLKERETELQDAERKAKQALSSQKELKEKVGALESELEAARKKAEETEKEFKEYKNTYRASVRKRAVGAQLASLSTAEHGEFKNITVLAVNPGEVRLQHEHGVASLPLGSLPEALRNKFGYDPEEAAAWAQAKMEEALKKEEEALLAQNFGASGKGGKGDKKAKTTSASAPGAAAQRQREDRIAFMKRRQAEIMAAVNRVKNDRQSCPVYREVTLKSYQNEYNLLAKTIQQLSQ